MFCRKKPSTNKYTSKFTANFKISKNFLKPLEVLSGFFFLGGVGKGRGLGLFWVLFWFGLLVWVFSTKEKEKQPRIVLH